LSNLAEYLREFESICKTVLAHESGDQGEQFNEKKMKGQKSCDTVPLNATGITMRIPFIQSSQILIIKSHKICQHKFLCTVFSQSQGRKTHSLNVQWHEIRKLTRRAAKATILKYTPDAAKEWELEQ
jgi:hypothetical protein